MARFILVMLATAVLLQSENAVAKPSRPMQEDGFFASQSSSAFVRFKVCRITNGTDAPVNLCDNSARCHEDTTCTYDSRYQPIDKRQTLNGTIQHHYCLPKDCTADNSSCPDGSICTHVTFNGQNFSFCLPDFDDIWYDYYDDDSYYYYGDDDYYDYYYYDGDYYDDYTYDYYEDYYYDEDDDYDPSIEYDDDYQQDDGWHHFFRSMFSDSPTRKKRQAKDTLCSSELERINKLAFAENNQMPKLKPFDACLVTKGTDSPMNLCNDSDMCPEDTTCIYDRKYQPMDKRETMNGTLGYHFCLPQTCTPGDSTCKTGKSCTTMTLNDRNHSFCLSQHSNNYQDPAYFDYLNVDEYWVYYGYYADDGADRKKRDANPKGHIRRKRRHAAKVKRHATKGLKDSSTKRKARDGTCFPVLSDIYESAFPDEFQYVNAVTSTSGNTERKNENSHNLGDDGKGIKIPSGRFVESTQKMAGNKALLLRRRRKRAVKKIK